MDMRGDGVHVAYLDLLARRFSLKSEVVGISHDRASFEGILLEGIRGGDVSVDTEDPGPTEWAALLEAEMAFISASGVFDRAYYLQNNPDVVQARIDPLSHFCRFGWRELRKPAPWFDVWWYWVMYLDPAVESINPLAHYLLVGQADGLLPRPDPSTISFPDAAKTDAPPPQPPGRRICLYAGYDPDGLIDDYVVDYLKELGKFCDIYYLADSDMSEEELDRIRPFVKGAWARRHGEYDFGSYSRLARDLVGWELIDTYDELVLANDSCYLVKGLDGVFGKMDSDRCSWWGLQASKGTVFTRNALGNAFSKPIPMREVKHSLVAGYEHDYTYDFHVGSYFLAFRREVFTDEAFRRLLSSVVTQKSKKGVVQKYEIGLTRLLIGKGYDFSTYVDDLYPFHPIYSENHFRLLELGFPLFKRYLLTENHYKTQGLLDWKERILSHSPDAPVDVFERNLLRVADNAKLYRNMRVTLDQDGEPQFPALLSNEEFERQDAATPKYDHWWAFPVCGFDDLLTGNDRAVFEAVRDDPSIKKIVLTRKRHIEASGANVVVVPLLSPEGQYHLLRSKQVFLKHSIGRNAHFPLSEKLHNFINLWHGIPLKRFGYASLDMDLEWAFKEHGRYKAIISSSKVDALAMAAAFYPFSYRDIWITGLPRNDFILCEESELPEDFRAQSARLAAELGGRRLVLFAPTFKNDQADAYYRFTDEELARLERWQLENGVVLGVREHMADKARTYSSMLKTIGGLDLSSKRYPNIEILYRSAAMLVTDYSSCIVDFMLTGRPVVSFAYDHERYSQQERGLFYDMESVIPGAICREFSQLMCALEAAVAQPPGREPSPDYLWKRSFFFSHVDSGNSGRVVQRVRQLFAKG